MCPVGPTFNGPHQPTSVVISAGTMQLFRAHPSKDAIRDALSHHYVVQHMSSSQGQTHERPTAPERRIAMTIPLEAMERAFLKTIVQSEETASADRLEHHLRDRPKTDVDETQPSSTPVAETTTMERMPEVEARIQVHLYWLTRSERCVLNRCLGIDSCQCCG